MEVGHALVHGATDHLEQDVNEALGQVEAPLSLIEGPLMNGMRRVGDLFGESIAHRLQEIDRPQEAPVSVAVDTTAVPSADVDTGPVFDTILGGQPKEAVASEAVASSQRPSLAAHEARGARAG